MTSRGERGRDGRDLASLFRASASLEPVTDVESEREHNDNQNILYEQEIFVTISSSERDRDDRSASLLVRVALQSESSRKMQVIFAL